jgi:hypothetical protein
MSRDIVAYVARHHNGADDGIRTRDPHLGKVMLYQLSHVRMPAIRPAAAGNVPGVRTEL